ncbi:MAG: helix-turn-helix domain-containing protein [Paludibacter sp.]
MDRPVVIDETTDSINEAHTVDEVLPELIKAAACLKENPDFIASILQADFIASIRKIMREDNINATTLAERLNKSRQYISKILNENANFKISSIAEIICALDLNIELRISRSKKNFQIIDFFKMDHFCLQQEYNIEDEHFSQYTSLMKKTKLQPSADDSIKLVG